MHEYSIVQALLAQVEEQVRAHGASRVRRLEISIGELSGVELPLLSAAYASFRERTPCAEAELELRSVPARWQCPRCERSVERGEILRCRSCGRPARLAEGDEIILERIEMEVSHV